MLYDKLNKTKSAGRPLITSYDSGYEHSVEHWFEVRRMVERSQLESRSTLHAGHATAGQFR